MDVPTAEISSQELNSTLLVTLSKTNTMSSNEIKHALEEGDTMKRANALECIIRMHLNGESQNHMIMTVIKYITPIDDHYIKKLVLYFWEVVDKLDKDGKLLSVIILICSFLRNDLQHPNEYVRGITLRFLCRVTERDLIEPLISSIVQNLKHRVAYVRRNAVLAVHAIYRKFPDLLPDAVDLIETFIRNETDVSARRNAFDVLATFSSDRAAAYLADFLRENELAESGGVFLMCAADFCQQRIRANPYDKAKYVPILFAILQSKRPAVRFQCASTLLSLSSSQTAIREALLTFVDILKTHSDNSVRLIVVEKLSSMRACYLPILQSSMLDILSALQSCSMEIRERLVLLARDLITEQNVESFVHAMRKELIRVQNDQSASNASVMAGYKLVLVRAISTAVMQHPKVADVILPILLDYICESNSAAAGNSLASNGLLHGNGVGSGGAGVMNGGSKGGSAMTGAVYTHASMMMSSAAGACRGGSSSSGSNIEVALLIKEALLVQPLLRPYTLNKLIELLPLISSAAVARTVMWIFGAYATEKEVVVKVFDAIHSAVHPLPLQRSSHAAASAKVGTSTVSAAATTAAAVAVPQAVTTVREDGTYATSYVYRNKDGAGGAGNDSGAAGEENSGLRNLILNGEYFLATTLASTLAKMVIYLFSLNDTESGAHDEAAGVSASNSNSASAVAQRVRSDAMEILTAIIDYGTSEGGAAAVAMGEDAQEHIRLCLAILAHPQTAFYVDFMRESQNATAVVGQRQLMQSRLGGEGGGARQHTEMHSLMHHRTNHSLQHMSPHKANGTTDRIVSGSGSRRGSKRSVAAAWDAFIPVDAPITFAPLSDLAGDALVGQGGHGMGGMLDDDAMATMCVAGGSYHHHASNAGGGYDYAGSMGEESNFLTDASSVSSLWANSGRRGEAAAARDRTWAYLHQIEQVAPYSGYEDEIYVEGSVSVNRFNVTVSWLLVNQTDETFRNVTIELASLGGMRLLERPQTYTLEARAAIKVHTSLKSSATETGVVFGSLLYERSNGKLVYCPLLNVRVDIMNYVKPAICATSEFRDKWRAYDWENKINIATFQWGSLREYVAYIARELNMHLLDSPFDEDATTGAAAHADVDDEDGHSTSNSSQQDDEEEDDDNAAGTREGGDTKTAVANDECDEADDVDDNDYVSCNLYARTIFNEDALANISVERDAHGKINGIIRIRSNTQSVAYGIGEKINMLDKCSQNTAS